MITSLSNGFNRVVIHTNNLEIMNTEGRWLIRHVPREDDRIADYLAKLSSEGRIGLQVYDDPHASSKILIQDKARGAIDQMNMM
ncbi:hypothetical protein Gotur_017803 [Gossypium turneri]